MPGDRLRQGIVFVEVTSDQTELVAACCQSLASDRR